MTKITIHKIILLHTATQLYKECKRKSEGKKGKKPDQGKFRQPKRGEEKRRDPTYGSDVSSTSFAPGPNILSSSSTGS